MRWIRKHNRKGMTLTELLVASSLMGIVMVGTLSVDYAFRSMRAIASQDSLGLMNTSATMTSIMRGVESAVGDASSPGLVSVNANTFCARQDADSDPNDYTSDMWTCYTRNAQYINTCQYSEGTILANCPAVEATRIGAVACLDAPTCGSYGFVFTLTNDASLKAFYMDVTLTTRPNPTAVAHPLNNPTKTVTSRIAPLGHSY